MLPKNSIGQIHDYFTGNPLYYKQIAQGFLDFFELSEPEEFYDLELTPMQEGIVNEWLVYDFRLENGNNLMQEYCEANRQNISPELLRLYDGLIKTEHFSFFEILTVSLDEGLTMRDLKTGKTYDIKEKSATHFFSPGNLFYNRVAKVDDHWELVGAENAVIPAIKVSDSIRDIFLNDKKKITIKDSFSFVAEKRDNEDEQDEIFSKEVDPKEARFRLAEFLAKFEISKFVSVEQVLKWFEKIEDKTKPFEAVSLLFGLIPDKLKKRATDEITDILADVANTTPREEFGGKSPLEKTDEAPDRMPEIILGLEAMDGDKCWDKLNEAHRLMKKESYTEAIKTWRDVFDLFQKEAVTRPDVYRFFANKGVCHFACGEEKEGKQMMELALKLNPNYGFAKMNLTKTKQLNWKIMMGSARYFVVQNGLLGAGISKKQMKRWTFKKMEKEYKKIIDLKKTKEDSAQKYYDYITRFGINFATEKPVESIITERGRKIKPNELCPCGSNVKFKKCHGKYN